MDLITTVTTAATLLPLATQLGQVTLDKCVSSYMTNPAPPPPVEVVEDLDVPAAVRTAQALIQNVLPESREEDEWEDIQPDSRDVVRVCVMHLKESMSQLQKDMLLYERALDAHHSKWFSNWRTFHAHAHIQTMKRHKRLFDLRFKMLLDVVSAVGTKP